MFYTPYYQSKFAITRRSSHILAKHENKTCIFVVFVCSLSPSIINYACPNFRTTCAIALMLALQHEFELRTLPSIMNDFYTEIRMIKLT